MAKAGLAWMPTLIQGLDIWYQRTRAGRRPTGDGPIEFPALLPSDYFHWQIRISFVDDLLEVKMVGNILGADDTRPASTWPDSQTVIAGAAGTLSPVIREKIFRDNVWEFFALD